MLLRERGCVSLSIIDSSLTILAAASTSHFTGTPLPSPSSFFSLFSLFTLLPHSSHPALHSFLIYFSMTFTSAGCLPSNPAACAALSLASSSALLPISGLIP